MKGMTVVSPELLKKCSDVTERFVALVTGGARLVIVKAPPGSGKTYTLLKAVEKIHELGKTVAIATQTNSQADDLCDRLLKAEGKIPFVRLVSEGQATSRFPCVSKAKEIPHGTSVVVSTAAKWAFTESETPYDHLFVDEAWQLKAKDLPGLLSHSAHFAFIGDPGQIPPVVTVDTRRWDTAAVPPHEAVPEVLLRQGACRPEHLLTLPATWRVPHDTAHVVGEFYDFEFDAIAAPRERTFQMRGSGRGTALEALVPALEEHSLVSSVLPAVGEDAFFEVDHALCEHAVRLVQELVKGQIDVTTGERRNAPQRVTAADIGLVATHRKVVSALKARLSGTLNDIKVDTPERWQGLEVPIMLAVHPLSSVFRPSQFDLETGRLCVMASRHRSRLILLSRGHVPNMLESHSPQAAQPLGKDDIEGRGHDRHLRLLAYLAEHNLWIPSNGLARARGRAS